MGYRIIREPFMLMETINMLYKYVNGITMPKLMKQWKLNPEDPLNRDSFRRLNRIQEILDQVCQGVDANDPRMQKFFGNVECGCEEVFLAQLMVSSFCTLEKPDFWQQVEEICGIWRRLQADNRWILPTSTGALVFSDGEEHPGSLLRQVRALNYPAEFRLELCDTLEHFEENLWELAKMIEPLSLRLQEAYQRESWIFEPVLEYWENVFATVSPLEMIAQWGLKDELQKAGDMTWVALATMNTNKVTVYMKEDVGSNLDHNCLYIGSAITSTSFATRDRAELDSVLVVLKCLSDRKRLELLCSLAERSSYGQALADQLGIDPGNVSRNLGMLHGCGLLRQRRTTVRTYYETDRDAFQQFLKRLEETVFKG